MLKIVANVSKKVPIPGLNYSSQSFMAGIEVEVSDGSTPEQLQHRIREVYHLLEHAVDTEIRSCGGVSELTESTAANPSMGKGRGARHGGDRRNHAEHTRRPNRQAVHENAYGQEHLDSTPTPQSRPGRTATQAQQKAVFAISKANGIERKVLLDRLRDEYGASRVEDLSVSDASELIDSLKSAS